MDFYKAKGILVFCLWILFVICLPKLSGQRTVGLTFHSEKVKAGYTLFSPLSSKSTFLIDNCGFLVKKWDSEYFPGQVSYLLDNGSLLRTARIGGFFSGGGVGGRIEIYEWDGTLSWSYNFADEKNHQHHVVYPMPNGNILVLLWDAYSREEAIAAGFNPLLVPSNGIWSEKITEIKPEGRDSIDVIWEWKLWDHLIQDFDSTKLYYGIVMDHPELLDINFRSDPGPNPADWIHANALDYNHSTGQILINSKHHNEFYVLDRNTTIEEASGHQGGKYGKGGDFLYRWGNPASYRKGTESDRKLFGQHDVQWTQKNGDENDHIIIFNNGSNRSDGLYATVDEIKPPYAADGSYIFDASMHFDPKDYFWSYKANPPTSFFSPRISGVQRLDNSNTLICEGNSGRFFEIDPEGTLVWEYINPVSGFGFLSQGATPFGNDVFKVTRYGLDFPGFSGKNLTASVPLELNSTPYDCLISAVNDTESKNSHELVSILQNPVYDVLILKNMKEQNLELILFDLNGQVKKQRTSASAEIVFDVSGWTSGFYILHVSSKDWIKNLKFALIKI